MRTLIALLIVSTVACGCGEGAAQSRLAPLARGLAEAWQPVSRDLKLQMQAEAIGDAMILHCALANVSGKTIEVDASALPWNNNAGLFSVNAVTADGRVEMQQPIPPPVEMVRLSAPRAPVAIAPGESIKGSFNLALMPIRLDRKDDWLLLWSYRMIRWNSDDKFLLSGVTLLNAKPPVTARATIKLETPNATSVPTQQLKQDLLDAPETLAINDSVIGLKAFPWQDRIRLISEHGTPLPPTLRVQAIWMLKDDQIWSADTIDETPGESNESSRDFRIDAGPEWDSMASIDVVMKLRDDKGATHWLAARHQGIAGVE